MTKQKIGAVYGIGAAALCVFTFTDLAISERIATAPFWARILEVAGVVPFCLLAVTSCLLLVFYWNPKNEKKRMAGKVLCAIAYAAVSVFCGYLSFHYIEHGFGDLPQGLMLLPISLYLFFGAFLATGFPEEKGGALAGAAGWSILYFCLVELAMHVLKLVFGRMRFAAMTDPAVQFSRWYVPHPRLTFDDRFASFPSGHAMNAIGCLAWIWIMDALGYGEKAKKRAEAAAAFWALLIAVSRVFAGAHFASDVTCGLLLAYTLFLFCDSKRAGSRKPHPASRSAEQTAGTPGMTERMQ